MTRRELVELLEDSAKLYPAYELTDLPVVIEIGNLDVPIEFVHIYPDRISVEIENDGR